MHVFLLAGCSGPTTLEIAPSPVEEVPLIEEAPRIDDAPLIDEALQEICGTVDPAEIGPPGDAFHRLASTTTVCNDGSPSHMYLRRATDPAHSDDWVVYLEGGGNCHDWGTCVERWCGTDFYDAGKMSSRFHPEVLGAGGVASREVGNSLAGWNHVYLPYCSSDQWVGQARDTVLDGDPPFRLHFEGHTILDHALDVLDEGAASDDGEVTLDPLVDAETIVLAGLSAGGFGVSANLDWLAARYSDKPVLGVIDAMLYPSLEYFDDPAVTSGIEAGLVHQYEVDYGEHWLGFVDASCLEAQGDVEPWRCVDVGEIYARHLQTPFVLNFDVHDEVISPFFTNLGASGEDFAQAAEASLRDLAATRPELSIRGQACSHHANLDSDLWYAQVTVADALSGGPPITLHDTIVSFLAGDRVVAVDDWLSTTSACP